MSLEDIQKLEELARPLAEYLAEHYDPHCCIVVTDGRANIYQSQMQAIFKQDDQDVSFLGQKAHVLVTEK